MIFPLETLFVLLLVTVVVAITWFHHAYTLDKRKPLPERRPLPALDALPPALGRAAETGGAIHISPGGGTIDRSTTMAETVVGLLATERLANQAALKGAPVLVSSGDAVAHLSARGLQRQAFKRAGRDHDYDPASIQLLTHEHATAYAAGVMTLYERQRLEASQLIGHFGHEFLLFAEEGARKKIPHVIGSTSVSALPIMLLNTENPLIGEEVFAAEAYLANIATPQARLMTQDTLRTIVIVLIVGGILYTAIRAFQPQLGLPALPGV
jgi:hypothetical protein